MHVKYSLYKILCIILYFCHNFASNISVRTWRSQGGHGPYKVHFGFPLFTSHAAIIYIESIKNNRTSTKPSYIVYNIKPTIKYFCIHDNITAEEGLLLHI